ncbi:MAG: dihydrofolate reductase family protein [Mucilaginibacter sp.]|uniref:dihydrofolate reductase family protein n=1 Tax=Mucilaginibacter sp. TaxID=1882438 RepID=UPI003263A360
MRKLSVFNFISLDGYYKDLNNSMQWHEHGGEEADFSKESSQGGDILLFGRVTYDMMYSFWPTDAAKQSMPEVADNMNRSEKIVFSNTLKKADWDNTTIISGGIVEQVKKLKATPGKDMTILGSGTIVSQFAEADLIDKYIIMIDPIALGGGISIFTGMEKTLDLKLTSSRAFKSGVMLLNYDAV